MKSVIYLLIPAVIGFTMALLALSALREADQMDGVVLLNLLIYGAVGVYAVVSILRSVYRQGRIREASSQSREGLS
ncbi:MAG: hypothetical protein QXI60_00780 [Thermofilaceae archaeon]